MDNQVFKEIEEDEKTYFLIRMLDSIKAQAKLEGFHILDECHISDFLSFVDRFTSK